MLAGRRQIFIRLAECNLDCEYCDTDFVKSSICRIESLPGSGSFVEIPSIVGVQKIVSVVTEWLSLLPGAHHSVSITGGEPLLSLDALEIWLPALRAHIPVHLETNGTMISALTRVGEHVDYISMDVKLPSTAGCTDDLWEIHRIFLREASGLAAVSVKTVVGAESDLNEINQVCDIISAVDDSIPLFLQPVTLPDGTLGISVAHILRLQEQASAHIRDVRVIPQMHKLLGVL